MTVDSAVLPAREARVLPVYRSIMAVLRDPLDAFEEIGREVDGELVQLDAKVCKPYLVTAPEHVQHVLRGNQDNYARGGMFYDPLKAFFGGGILGMDRRGWEHSRRIIQPKFTARHVKVMQSKITELMNEGLDPLEEAARTGRPIDAMDLMSSLVTTAIVGLIFGQRITREQVDELAEATDAIILAMIPRLVTPFVPGWVPRPRDRAFTRAIRTFDRIMYPLVEEKPEENDDDLLTMLLGAPGPDGRPPSTQWLRDNFTGLYGAASETTVSSMIWLIPILARHPEVYGRLCAEIDEVVGDARVTPEHLPQLVYTRQVIDETLRVMPVGWLFSRRALEEDVIDGVRIPAGADVLISPMITHRNPGLWERPLEFDPDRFAPGRKPPHRYAYFPFGGGHHSCLGNHLFASEAQILLASLFSRFRLVSVTPENPTRQVGAAVRPKERVEMILRPAR